MQTVNQSKYLAQQVFIAMPNQFGVRQQYTKAGTKAQVMRAAMTPGIMSETVTREDSNMLETLTIEPESPARCAVIWLHGLGADGHDFEPLVRDWGLVGELGARFVLPHAPYRPVTLNQGMVMRAWYDIYDLSFAQGEDRDGIEAAAADVFELIGDQHRQGIPGDKIILAGFSQGGALALHAALRSGRPLAGVLVLSAYLPLGHLLQEQARADSDKLAIRMDHGENDPVVPLIAAERARRLLEAQGYAVDFNKYSMGHSLCPEQARSLRGWIVDRLDPQKNRG